MEACRRGAASFMGDATQDLYRQLPQVGGLLASEPLERMAARYSRALVADVTRALLEEVRAQVRDGQHTEGSLRVALDALPRVVEARLGGVLRPSLRRVINATGVILQTNLGRAPLSEAALARVVEVARGYCNVEMDLATGERGRRDSHADRLILEVLAIRAGVAREGLGDRAALVVNNCAAATFLALNSLAEGGEVIVSRGELVEIGGGFRVPDILRKSGAVLHEVGTTNRTRVGDYAAAITPETRLILRVHQANFRMEGFVEQPTLGELVALGAQSGVPVFEDQGTGCVVDLGAFGMAGESSWVESAASGVALVASSGDKLLGGPQCGLLVGAREPIERIRANPLFRALRVDKLTYAALEATLLAYLAGDEGTIPAIAMLRMGAEEIRARCVVWAEALGSAEVSAEVVPTRSLVGGGTTPGASLPSFAVALRDVRRSEGALAARLRGMEPGGVGRVSEGRVLLDLRTVMEGEDEEVIGVLRGTIAEVVTGEKSYEVRGVEP